MPKDDWKKSSIPTLFTDWGAWPWGLKKDCPDCDGAGSDETCYGIGKPHSVLDVGCGLSLKSKFIDTPLRVGFDIHRPYLEAVEADVPWIPVQGDVTKISEIFLPNSFDLVIALDIIEHVEKDQALKLLKDLEEIARVAVIIETPRGLLPQDLDILGFGQDHLQTHRCGFEVEELEELGYQVFVRDYTLAPIQRVKGSTEVQTECQLLNAIKRVDNLCKFCGVDRSECKRGGILVGERSAPQIPICNSMGECFKKAQAELKSRGQHVTDPLAPLARAPLPSTGGAK